MLLSAFVEGLEVSPRPDASTHTNYLTDFSREHAAGRPAKTAHYRGATKAVKHVAAENACALRPRDFCHRERMSCAAATGFRNGAL